ncbi:MAG TPA: PIG-L family deacetylase [Thermoanaerobaculia bacterium]
MGFVEQDLIPYAAERLLGERLLVLAPHPDDEVIGCGGVLAHHVREGRRVHVIVATDGSEAPRGEVPKESFTARREAETNAGLAHLGAPAAEFLRIPDRALDDHREVFQRALRERILELRPDLLVLPSPIEIHPDHRALSLAAVELIQRDLDLSGALALCRIAFMEITQAVRPTVLVDITDVAALKYEAIEKHASQQGQRNYSWFSQGLGQFRTMTLGPESRHAEAFHVVSAAWLRTAPLSAIEAAVRGDRGAAVEREAVPVTVLVRTLDRPRLLAEALASIRAASDAPIVVVNDGGTSVAPVTSPVAGVTLVEHQASRGRSAAMNAAVDRADTEWIAFLDDDDLYYPEHLATLTRAAASRDATAWYTDAVSTIYATGESGAPEIRSRLRTYARGFDPEFLLFDNYIPLPTLLVRKKDVLRAGGFDPAFDLFEDWDFLIRLSRLGRFERIPRLTCEIRHFLGSETTMLGNPAGSPGYLQAKLKVWRKHGVLDSPERVLTIFERLKEATAAAENRLQEEIGRAAFLEGAIAELQRDKQKLIDEGPLRATEAASLRGERDLLEARVTHLNEQAERLEEERHRLEADLVRAKGAAEELRISAVSSAETVKTLFAEIARLNALIDEMQGTRAWKLHRAVERIRGRR